MGLIPAFDILIDAVTSRIVFFLKLLADGKEVF
jgi:hypothetical protein